MIRQWLTRHHGIVVLVGALIVFLTYIANEVLHDRYRDLGDAIGTATRTAVLRKDLTGIDNQLGPIKADLLIVQQSLAHRQQSTETMVDQTSSEKDNLDREITVRGFQVSNMEILVDTIEQLSAQFPLTVAE